MKESSQPQPRFSQPYPPAKEPPTEIVTGGVRVSSYRNLRIIECGTASLSTVLQAERVTAIAEGMHALGVVGTVVVRNQLLLLRRALHDAFLPGNYELPSGGIESDEEILPALLRELREETGIIAPNHTELLASFDISYNERATRHFAFLVLHSESVIILDPNEHIEHVWCPIEDTMRLHHYGLDQDAEPWIIEEAKRRLAKFPLSDISDLE